MQQFVVPQFIDVEDKIIGPVTIRQFIIMLVAGLIIFLAYRFSDVTLFITILALVGGGALILAFVKVNGQPFHYFILNLIQTRSKPKMRIWQKVYTNEQLKFLREQGIAIEVEHEEGRKRARPRHIRDLSLIVNTGGYYQPDAISPELPRTSSQPAFTQQKR